MQPRTTPLLSVCVIAIVCIGSFGADEPHSKETVPSKEMVRQLSDAILKHCPDATIEVTNTEFLAKYETMRFTMHHMGKNGEYTSKTYEEEGPQRNGFLLKVSLSRGRGGLPQEISKLSVSEPYFNRYFDAPDAADGRHHYLVKFYSGYNINRELERSIKAAIPKDKDRRPSTK